jgi:hypothetical protein
MNAYCRFRVAKLAHFLTVAAIAAPAFAQTNLLSNGDFETNAGFSGGCQPFWGNFCGFDGWNTDFADDGDFNGSWGFDTPGGFRLANVFPAGAAPNDPDLVGENSALILGSFDSGTPTVLAQQVAVTAGQSIRAGIFAYSDSTRVRANGFPDTVYGQFTRNRVLMRLEFLDFLGLQIQGSEIENVIFDPENDPGFNFTTFRNPQFEDKWIESVATATAPIGAEFARIAVLYTQVNNAGGLAFLDTASIVNLSAGTPLTGDFNFDGLRNAEDLNMITLAVGGGLKPADNRFELTGDAALNSADIAAWQALAPLAGDYNGDRVVNAADYTVWRDSLGSTTQLAADGSGNGVIDQADYTFWVARYGTSGSEATAVPEPAGAVLVAMGALAAGRRCRLRLGERG